MFQTLTELIQAEVFTQIDFNKSRLLTERELIGGGLRFRILKYNNLKFRLGTSYFLNTKITMFRQIPFTEVIYLQIVFQPI